MTRKQLKTMLSYKGGCYAGLSSLFSVVLGILSSLVIAQSLCKEIWFLSYRLAVHPLLYSIPVLLILGVAVPQIIYRATDRQSIVDRLRESEQ